MINKIKINKEVQPAEIAYQGNMITAYIFNDLEDVAAGASIFCDTEEGQTLRFKVIEKKFYNFDARPEKIFDEDEEGLLKLINRPLSWQTDYNTEADRLVVTARRTDL